MNALITLPLLLCGQTLAEDLGMEGEVLSDAPAIVLGEEIIPVNAPIFAALEGISLSNFARSGVVRVYPKDGIQARDSISASRKCIEIMLWAQKEGKYTLVVAAVQDEQLIYLEKEFTVGTPPAKK